MWGSDGGPSEQHMVTWSFGRGGGSAHTLPRLLLLRMPELPQIVTSIFFSPWEKHIWKLSDAPS